MRIIMVGVLLVLTAGLASSAPLGLTGTIWDFLYSGTAPGIYNGFAGQGHPDFQDVMADDPGIVENMLGVDGLPVYASATTTVTTHGKTYFDMWYRDTPGYNVSLPFSLTVDEVLPGIYRYANNNFFPIDGQGFGNQGASHNYAFTVALPTVFTYQPGQILKVRSDDDAWVFVNDKLLIDLGGVHDFESDTVSLDGLGLLAGSQYSLKIFFAERHEVASVFALDTNIQLQSIPEPGTVASVVLGLAALAGWKISRRRRP